MSKQKQIFTALSMPDLLIGESCEKELKKKSLTKEDVILDNMEFIDCKFVNCQILYAGGPYKIEGCEFENKYSFRLPHRR